MTNTQLSHITLTVFLYLEISNMLTTSVPHDVKSDQKIKSKQLRVNDLKLQKCFICVLDIAYACKEAILKLCRFDLHVK